MHDTHAIHSSHHIELTMGNLWNSPVSSNCVRRVFVKLPRKCARSRFPSIDTGANASQFFVMRKEGFWPIDVLLPCAHESITQKYFDLSWYGLPLKPKKTVLFLWFPWVLHMFSSGFPWNTFASMEYAGNTVVFQAMIRGNFCFIPFRRGLRFCAHVSYCVRDEFNPTSTRAGSQLYFFLLMKNG